MIKLLWEWKTRFTFSLMVRGRLIVTSDNTCDVISCPVVVRRYENVDGEEQWYRK